MSNGLLVLLIGIIVASIFTGFLFYWVGFPKNRKTAIQFLFRGCKDSESGEIR